MTYKTKQHPLGDTGKHSSATIAELNALISDGNVSPVVKNRVTKTADYSALNTDRYISIDSTSSDVEITLPTIPSNGQELDVNSVDMTNVCEITGHINGQAAYTITITTSWDNYHFVYNTDETTWEIR